MMAWILGTVIGFPVTLGLRRFKGVRLIIAVLILVGTFAITLTIGNQKHDRALSRYQERVAVVRAKNEEAIRNNARDQAAWSAMTVELPSRPDLNPETREWSFASRSTGWLFPEWTFPIKDMTGVTFDKTSGVLTKTIWVNAQGRFYENEPTWLWDRQQKKLPQKPESNAAGDAIVATYLALMVVLWLAWSAEQAVKARAGRILLDAERNAAKKHPTTAPV